MRGSGLWACSLGYLLDLWKGRGWGGRRTGPSEMQRSHRDENKGLLAARRAEGCLPGTLRPAQDGFWRLWAISELFTPPNEPPPPLPPAHPGGIKLFLGADLVDGAFGGFGPPCPGGRSQQKPSQEKDSNGSHGRTAMTSSARGALGHRRAGGLPVRH